MWYLRGWYDEFVELDDDYSLGLYMWPDRPARLRGRAQNFTTSDDPTLIKLSPSGTFYLCQSAPLTTMARDYQLQPSAHET